LGWRGQKFDFFKTPIKQCGETIVWIFWKCATQLDEAARSHSRDAFKGMKEQLKSLKDILAPQSPQRPKF